MTQIEYLEHALCDSCGRRWDKFSLPVVYLWTVRPKLLMDTPRDPNDVAVNLPESELWLCKICFETLNGCDLDRVMQARKATPAPAAESAPPIQSSQ